MPSGCNLGLWSPPKAQGSVGPLHLTPGSPGSHSATAADKDAEAEDHPEGACCVCGGDGPLRGAAPRARAPSAPSPRLWNRRDSSQEVAGDKCQKRLVLIVVSRQRPHTEPLLEGHVKAVTWYRQPLGVCTPAAPAPSLGQSGLEAGPWTWRLGRMSSWHPSSPCAVWDRLHPGRPTGVPAL